MIEQMKIVVFLYVFTFPVIIASAQKAQMQIADELYERGSYFSSAKAYKNLFESNPENNKILFRLAYTSLSKINRRL